MKISLMLGDLTPRAGYLNLTPLGSPPTDIVDLDNVVADGEAIEILALDVLDHLDPNVTNRALAGWIAKLRHGGTITLSGLDLREVCRLVSTRTMSLDRANELIYGRQDRPWRSRKACLSLGVLEQQLLGNGLVIVRKSYNGVHYGITAKRP